MTRPRSAVRLRAAATFLLLTSLALVVACSPSTEASPSDDEPTASPTADATPEATEEATPEESATPPPSGIGTQVLVGDEQYMTVTAVEEWPGTDTQQPAADNVFVTVNIRIDGITTTSFASDDFTLRDVDGMTYSNETGRAPHLSFQDGLAPDTYYAGWVTYEVPADVADELVLVYSPSFLSETYEVQLY